MLVSEKEIVLEVKNLTVNFGKGNHKFTAIDDVSFHIFKGETFGLVGESGSGKTTIGRSIMRINEVTEGQILYHGKTIHGKIPKDWDREITQKIQMIFQDPMASLNERAKVDYIVAEGLYPSKKYKDEAERQEKVRRALVNVGLLPEFSNRFPHEFSGGQRQRIGIARALVMEPEFIIADEPISALDVSIRAQVLNLLANFQRQNHLTFLFIAHDLSVVRFITDRTAVIYQGKIVELAATEQLFTHPLHPYTRALLSAVPEPNPYKEREKVVEIYDPTQHRYADSPPSFVEIEDGHFILANEEELTVYRTSLKREVNE
ncbi:ATP-binding cassette domain-containing protein [Lysinibacillus fusiformis]|uniref:ATP-binding cassette domain-containing protein n=1 Tax=Lysinibacillus fusiformis TaxID=28031 RepID=UPI0030B89295